MRKVQDVITYTSGRVRLWTHLMFKVKYCHRVFDYKQVKNRCAEILNEVAHNYRMAIDVMGFDGDHLHMIADIGLHSAPEAVKLFKGTTARKLFQEYPAMKKSFFWGSGLWNPSYWADGVSKKEYENIRNYVLNQGKRNYLRPQKGQTRLQLN